MSSLLLLFWGLFFLLELGEEESNPLLSGIRQVPCGAEIQIIPQPFPIVPLVRRRDRALCQYRGVLRQGVCRISSMEDYLGVG
jgi:hypothetical protein